MLRTRLCDLLGIEHPIIQGGMAWVATAELAAAVSNGGGLGIIGGGHMPTEVLRSEIRKAKLLTDKPFGVNLMLLTPHIDELIQVTLEEGVPVITTGAGNPGSFINSFKAQGTKVIPVVPTVALAQRMEKVGADAVIVEGTEAGGHVGELTTMVLVPQIVDAVSVPVIAAGGIADGRGLVAALALGASGVQMGTRFICATECTAHENYKLKIIAAKDRDTTVTARSTGHPVRVLKNKLSREFEKLEKEGAKIEDLEELGIGKLRAAVKDGEVDFGSLMAGQSAALVKRIEPAADIINEIVQDAQASILRLEGIMRETLPLT
ncbi:MAG TPA: enoyl-[acyl-carrier-protein] reductase FabK [Actinobacteria bacterium]|nr:enoyl-[acyl-carrier-protein] reductase FabK [Actinomycetota bacterium]